jgi:hypothetical protein
MSTHYDAALAGTDDTPCTPEPLVGAITSFLAHQKLPREDVRQALEDEIRLMGLRSLTTLRTHLQQSGLDWEYYASDALARRIHHLLADRILDEKPVLEGNEYLETLARSPFLMLANHLSYSDANVVEVLLHRSAHPDIADRLTVVAGPKVYSDLKRRFSSLCFGTIRTPQSSGVSSDDAVMNPREVAAAARRTIQIAQDRLAAGDALLVFAEGTRSRTAAMQPLLPGIARYLENPDLWVVPVGIAGSETLFPIGETSLQPSRIVVSIGRPVSAGRLRERAHGNRRIMMDTMGLAIASRLPASYRGAYGDGAADLDEARQVLAALSA